MSTVDVNGLGSVDATTDVNVDGTIECSVEASGEPHPEDGSA